MKSSSFMELNPRPHRRWGVIIPHNRNNWKVQVYLGVFFGQHSAFLIGRDVGLQKTRCFLQYRMDMFVHAPPWNRQDKSAKKTAFFLTFGLRFSVLRRVLQHRKNTVNSAVFGPVNFQHIAKLAVVVASCIKNTARSAVVWHTSSLQWDHFDH